MGTVKRPASWAWLKNPFKIIKTIMKLGSDLRQSERNLCFERVFIAATIVALAAGVLVAGPWAFPQAEAKTVTASCAHASTDAATLNSAITGSKPGDQILISGHCLLTGVTITAGI